MPQGFDSRFFNLAPIVTTGIFEKYEQGEFIMDKILPSRPVQGYTFTYKLYGNVGVMAEETGPGGEPGETSVAYDNKLAIAHEWRQAGQISDRDLKEVGDVRPLMNDVAEEISQQILLRKEFTGLQALLGNDPFNDLQAGGQAPPIVGGDWSLEGTDIIKDLTTARTQILKRAHVFPDTLIIGPDDEANMQNNPDFRQNQLGGTIFNQQNLMEGSIGRVKGMDVFVMTAVKQNQPGYPLSGEPNESHPRVGTGPGDVSPLLQGKAIVMKRGGNTGFMGIAEGFQSIAYRLERRRSAEIMGWMGAGPAIVRPNKIITIDTTGA